MKVLMGSAQPYLPEVSGGAQSSTHELVLELIKQGQKVSVVAGLMGNGWLGLRGRILLKLTRRSTVSDRTLGYPVIRGWSASAAAKETLLHQKFDVAVLPTSRLLPLAKEIRESGVPIVVYLRDVEFHELGGDLSELPDAVYVANSQFTADSYHRRFGVSATVIPPLFRRELYATPTTGKYVTFINPHPNKGVDIALDIAESCPEIPFCFVSGWVLPEEAERKLKDRLQGLANVILKPRTNRIRDIYAETKVLLAPSQWEEGWGRVVSEAQFSGIPALASRCGGLPESVGPGGILVERAAPLKEWVEAIRRLWHDEAAYNTYSEAALAHSRRLEIDPQHQIELFVNVLEQTGPGAERFVLQG